MPELRKDPLTDRWVIIAPERSLRPRDLRQDVGLRAEPFCPFCPGNESATGAPLAVVPGPVRSCPESTWMVRAVPNRYPVLRVEGVPEGRGEGLYDQLNGIGAHEVIIDTPLHASDSCDLTITELTAVARVYRDRMLDLQKDVRLKYLLVFKNRGALAGATLSHPHSQLIALPIVPDVVQRELAGAKRHFELRERCLFCDMIRQELRDGSRVVYDSETIVGFAPYASRFPFEVWLLPKAHQAYFEATSDEGLRAFARALRDVLGRLCVQLSDPAYNFVIHTCPVGMGDLPYFHWHVEITPILYHPSAGFELGSGSYINPTPPETAALYLSKSEYTMLSRRASVR